LSIILVQIAFFVSVLWAASKNLISREREVDFGRRACQMQKSCRWGKRKSRKSVSNAQSLLRYRR